MPVIVGITLKNKGYIDFKIDVDNPLSSFTIKNGVVTIGSFSKNVTDIDEINFWDDDPFNTTGKYLWGLKFY